MASHDNKPYLTPGEVAKLLKVSPITVRAWAQKGLLLSEATPGGHRRFLRNSVEQFVGQRRAGVQQRNKLRVLVVDDDQQVSGFFHEWLTGLDKPFNVSIANDGFEAGVKVHAFKPDIILLDLMMPKLDGFTVCSRIKADPVTSAIRVIAMSGYPTPENERRILEAGAEVCMPKPLDTQLLLGVLRTRLPRRL